MKYKHMSQHFRRTVARLARLFTVVSAFAGFGVRAAVFDFSAAYEGVTASSGSGLVSMSVFDEARLMPKSLNVASGSTFDLSAVNGVVAWSSGGQVYYYTYDAVSGAWTGESGAFGPVASDLRTAGGIVTWSTSGGTAHYRVFDRGRGQWRGGSDTRGAAFDLRAVDGVVAWSTGSSVHARVYDPIKGSWQARDVNSVTTGTLINTNGVVAHSSTTPLPGAVYYHTYDPTRTGWQTGSSGAGAPSDLASQNGVVAWSRNPAVYFSVYDPVPGQWGNGSVPASGYTADLTISNSVVVWTTATSSYMRGYGGGWASGPATRVPYFAVSTNSANQPLLVQFIDMSIGGLGWNWNFGDGSTSTKRSPTHRYTNFGAFLATETVTGSFGMSSTGKLVVTDITAPAGINVINGGAAFTTNSLVTLRLSATDNSGTVSFMRFSNATVAWTAWEPYATNKAWTLTAGDGLKTVSAQFADAATNLSAVASDSILLDTAPQPLVTVLSTNVAEAAGVITVRVSLSSAFARLVSINYTVSNGTATAGADFTAVSGRLDFQPGVFAQTFDVPITQDQLVEINETFHLVLSNPTNCVPGPPGVVTILDDDPPGVSFAATNFPVFENNSNGVVTVRLNAASGLEVTVGYFATNGTALAGLDFRATNGTITIPSGETNASFLVPILNDTLDELSETITLQLTGFTNALAALPTNATLTILDDDAPRIGFSRKLYPVFENEFIAIVNVWLTKPVTMDVGFDYLVLGGTATPGADYFADSGRRTITAGSTNVTIIVNLVDNGTAEPDETIHLSLSNITHAEPGPNAEADILIYDEDGAPRLLSPRWGMNGLFQATAAGKAGQVFTVRISTDLLNWMPAFTLTNTTGTIDFSDPGSLAQPRRFYKTSVP